MADPMFKDLVRGTFQVIWGGGERILLDACWADVAS